jgi:acyl-CoA thioesterase-1
MSLLFQHGKTVVFAGDSITDAGRSGGFGQPGDDPLGEGYVRDVVGLIQARYPARKLTFHNTGISGITTTELTERWDDDVLARSPDWVAVLIGINDCNVTLADDVRAVPPEKYELNYRDVLDRTAAAGARAVLLEPFYLWPAKQHGEHEQRTLSLLREYRRIVRGLAGESGSVFVELHDVFQEQLEHRSADVLGPDLVHPTPHGHLVIAHALLDAIGW